MASSWSAAMALSYTGSWDWRNSGEGLERKKTISVYHQSLKVVFLFSCQLNRKPFSDSFDVVFDDISLTLRWTFRSTGIFQDERQMVKQTILKGCHVKKTRVSSPKTRTSSRRPQWAFQRQKRVIRPRRTNHLQIGRNNWLVTAMTGKNVIDRWTSGGITTVSRQFM